MPQFWICDEDVEGDSIESRFGDELNDDNMDKKDDAENLLENPRPILRRSTRIRLPPKRYVPQRTENN